MHLILYPTRYLGHMYQAEALVALDRIADAISDLNPTKITDISCTFPEQDKTDQGWWKFLLICRVNYCRFNSCESDFRDL